MEPISENPDLPRNKRLKTNDSCDKFVDRDEKNEFEFSREPSMETLRQRAAEFANERDWNKYHTPRNLVLALVGEVGELAEIFQWKNEVKPEDIKENWEPQEVEHLEQEMSDVFIYLMRLATVCKIDLPKAVEAKMVLNAKKYPKEKCYGMNKKYNELD